MSDLVSLRDIEAAAARIAPYIVATPVIAMTPSGFRLKAENLQPIGAFKLRGALNALLSLPDDVRRRGVAAHSSGNHAQGVAYAARLLNISAVIVMPRNVSRAKLEATEVMGAEVILVDPYGTARYDACTRVARERGLTIVEPFNQREIIAATGTIGVEILRDCPGARAIAVPVSGGGLISGIAAAVKRIDPTVKVIGVEPELADDAAQSFAAGEIIRLDPKETGRTIADGLRVAQLGSLTWAHIHALVDEFVTVSEDEIREGVRNIARQARLLAEPSGAVALAGAMKLRLHPETSVSVVSGGNADSALLARIFAGD